MRFYCVEHQQDIYTGANHVGRVRCWEGDAWHHLGHDFPTEPYWEHCHGCTAIWFYKQEELPREKCPACKRRLVLSHLCHKCETLGYRLASGQVPDTPSGGGGMSCGSCDAELSAARWHFCLTLNMPLLTCRGGCPFCSAGLFPADSDELTSAFVYGNQYQFMRLGALNDDRPALMATGASSPDALFFLLAGQSSAIVLPRHVSREKIERAARRFRRVFDWPVDWAGALVVQRPAIFVRDGDKWRLKEPGILTGTIASGAVPDDEAAPTVVMPEVVMPEVVTPEAGMDDQPTPGTTEFFKDAHAVRPVAVVASEIMPVVAVASESAPDAQHPNETDASVELKLTDDALSTDNELLVQAEYGRAEAVPTGNAGDAEGETDAAPVQITSSRIADDGDGDRAQEKKRAIRQESQLPPAPSNRLAVWSITGAAALILGTIVVLIIQSFWQPTDGRNNDAQVINAQIINAPVSPQPTASTSPARTPVAPDGMIRFSAGSFTMGRDDGTELERPAHHATIENAFYLDIREVSCKEYENFLTGNPKIPPPSGVGWRGRRCPAGQERLPVSGVDWHGARAYAVSVGKRLPTEKEWEYAAREGRNVLYPWGSEWRPDAASVARSQRRLDPVDSHREGATPAGLLNMVGNVWEWTDSDITAYGGGPLPKRLANDVLVSRGKVIRGGAWNSDPQTATTTYRVGYPPRGAGDYVNTGFRCAMDAPSP